MVTTIFTVKKAAKEDLGCMTDLYLKGYNNLESYSYRRRRDAKAYLRWLYRRDREGLLLAVINDEIVGFIASDVNWVSIHGRVGAIHELVVHPRHRRRGIGKELVVRAIKRFEMEGLKRVELWVGLGNSAVRFYEKLGFIKEDTRGVWLRMSLKIGEKKQCNRRRHG